MEQSGSHQLCAWAHQYLLFSGRKCVERRAGLPHIYLINGNTPHITTGPTGRHHTGETNMKTIIATAALALSFAAPAAADVTDAQSFFAQGNASAAEIKVSETSIGNPVAAAQTLALTNESPAENVVSFDRARNVDVAAVQQKFALGNDSAAERILN
jgi:hypothetical protein